MFDQLANRGELPWMTTSLLGFSSALQSRWYLFALAGAVIISVVYMQLQTEAGKRLFDRLKLRMPMFGDIFSKLGGREVLSRFGYDAEEWCEYLEIA